MLLELELIDPPTQAHRSLLTPSYVPYSVSHCLTDNTCISKNLVGLFFVVCVEYKIQVSTEAHGLEMLQSGYMADVHFGSYPLYRSLLSHPHRILTLTKIETTSIYTHDCLLRVATTTKAQHLYSCPLNVVNVAVVAKLLSV